MMKERVNMRGKIGIMRASQGYMCRENSIQARVRRRSAASCEAHRTRRDERAHAAVER